MKKVQELWRIGQRKCISVLSRVYQICVEVKTCNIFKFQIHEKVSWRTERKKCTTVLSQVYQLISVEDKTWNIFVSGICCTHVLTRRVAGV